MKKREKIILRRLIILSFLYESPKPKKEILSFFGKKNLWKISHDLVLFKKQGVIIKTERSYRLTQKGETEFRKIPLSARIKLERWWVLSEK
jgi:predicted transcriptional regulator